MQKDVQFQKLVKLPKWVKLQKLQKLKKIIYFISHLLATLLANALHSSPSSNINIRSTNIKIGFSRLSDCTKGRLEKIVPIKVSSTKT